MTTIPAVLSTLSVTAANSIGWRHEAEPETLSIGLTSLDAATGGFPRGRITEIAGPVSSGRTTVLHRLLARATNRGEYCAVVDATNSFDPRTAAESGVYLDALVWVRCSGNLGYAMRTTDLLVHSGGFGAIALDICDVPIRELRRIPLSWWYRFRRAVEGTETILVILEREPQAKACASLIGEMSRLEASFPGANMTTEGRGSATVSEPQPSGSGHWHTQRVPTSCLFHMLTAGEFRFSPRKPARAGVPDGFRAVALDPGLRAEY